jgi:hypothetical protein
MNLDLTHHEHVGNDRTAFSVVPLTQADDELAYWLSKSPADRIAAIELIRRTLYGYDESTARLQRVFEVAERKPD